MTYHPAGDDVVERRGLVDVFANNKVGIQNGNLIVAGRDLAPVLLANDPQALGDLWFAVKVLGTEGDDKLEARHAAQGGLEVVASAEDVGHGRVVHCLRGEGGIIGGLVEKGRLCKVVEDWQQEQSGEGLFEGKAVRAYQSFREYLP